VCAIDVHLDAPNFTPNKSLNRRATDIGYDVISACDRWAAANAVRITTSNDRVSHCISGSTAIVAASCSRLANSAAVGVAAVKP